MIYHRLLYACALFVVLNIIMIDAKKSAKDWSKIDFDKIDEEWTSGDQEQELITEDEVYKYIYICFYIYIYL